MKTIIFLVIAAILVSLATLYGLFGPSQSGVKESNVTTTQEKELEIKTVEQITGEGSLQELFVINRNLECKISYVPPDMIEPVIGTYFVAGERMRGDFVINSPDFDEPFVSSMISDGDQFYSWSQIEGQAYGIKVDTSNFVETDSETLREPVPTDAVVSYDCKEWKNVDGSIFEPPGDILFQDLNQIFQSGMEYGTIYKEESI